jgi:hypothetical protein
MADAYNIPTIGLADDSSHDKPITRLQAAEIISAAQGVSFAGDDAVAYLIGQGLANSIASSPEEFDGAHTLTRAEALQWLHQIAVHNKLDLHKRPEEPSDINLIKAPSASFTLMPDFSSEPVTAEDFNLFGSSDFAGVRWGESKENIEKRFGESTELDFSNYETYPFFSVYYTSNGLLDGWKVNAEERDITASTPSLRTNKGIVLGESSYADVISKYGTAGVNHEPYLTYYYEIAPDGTYRDLSIFDPIQNPDQSFALWFLTDDETGKVIQISASSLRTAFKLF